MAKILVADDNSNIQKMVGLALRDQGIEVVAVGNGEAAVRKISDIRPDLVLADVFMPVRNGYEVCQYVKTDPSLAHIPVILLVGAFDPLDEQEAQRVGADGVLKKPFVPPDPLISMVKSALARAGVSLTGAPAAPAQAPRPAADLLMNPNLTPRPLGSVSPITAPTSISLPALGSEPEDIPMRPAPVKIDAGGSPLAFGNLLGSAIPKEEEDLGFIPTVHPEMATERDWRSPKEEEPEDEAEETPKHSWRRDGAEEAFGAADKIESKVSGWRESGPTAVPNARPHIAEWTPTKEKTDFVEADDAPETVPASALDKFVSEVRASTQAAPFAGDAWAAAIAAGSDEKTAVATEEKPAEPVVLSAPVPAVQEIPAAIPVHEPAPDPNAGAGETPEAAPKKSSLADSWFQTVASPWEAEARKATQLASTWDAPVVAAATETAVQQEQHAASGVAGVAVHENPSAYAAESQAVEVAPMHEGDSAVAHGHETTAIAAEGFVATGASPEASHEHAAASAGTAEAIQEPELAHHAPDAGMIHEQVSLSSAAVEAIREEAAQVTEAVQHEAVAPAAETYVTAAHAPEPSMDDLVAKVLAKMSPDVLQAVTRNILKSVVEGIVRDELNSKKP